MSKFITIPKMSSFNTDDFIELNEDGVELKISIPIDEIAKINDESCTGSLIDVDKGMDSRRCKGKVNTFIVMKNGEKIKSPYTAEQIMRMINETVNRNFSCKITYI
jgi:hypothetical protein